jgi:hypothetical protein
MEGITCHGIVPDEMWNALLDAVDEQCKAEDALRRKIAAAGVNNPPRRGRRNH